MSSISLHDLTITWPDGRTVLDAVSLELGPGRHGLVGANGAGKSTLVDVLAGLVPPTSGTVHVDGRVAHLPQNLASTGTVAATLGVEATLAALHRIEDGSVDQADFDAVGDDWDVVGRASVVLGRLGLDHLDLDRPVPSLSGGEAVLLALGARLLTEPDVLLLDEPTNNLDAAARRRLIDVVRGFAGTVVAASHDRELLDHVDGVIEVRAGGLRRFGGSWDHYVDAVAAEQETAARSVRDAAADVRRQRRDLEAAQTAIARRRRQGRQRSASGSQPKVLQDMKKNAAEASAGRVRGSHEADVDAAQSRLAAAEAGLRDDREIILELPATAVPTSRVVLTMDDVVLAHTGRAIDLQVHGPERIALCGANGVGKTTVLHTALGLLAPVSGQVRLQVPARHLPQRLDLLDPARTVVENVRAAAATADETEIRGQLARFLFRARRADQQVATLSGGELLRATLATVLLAEPAPQLLVLDEPTNNLDLVSTGHLVDALRAYRGALLVVSHDERFLADLDLTRRVEL